MKDIKVSKIQNSRIAELDMENIQFGKVYTDYMFVADYINGEWVDYRIEPYGPFSLSPATSALHYGQAIFEGMKAFKNNVGEISLFRPLENAKRLNISAERMVMPAFNENDFLHALKTLLILDSKWVPNTEGSSLYIRPYMFATDAFVGVKPSETYRFCIFCSPVGPYYSKPLAVKVEEKYTRAPKGGTGYAKCSGNYGASMFPTIEAQKQGYDQVIWTDGETHSFVEETGTTNIFFKVKDILYTPAVSDSILSGITRDSLIILAKKAGYTVIEDKIAVSWVVEQHAIGNLQEVFIAGTAATVVPIHKIGFRDSVLEIPIPQKGIATELKNILNNLRTGATPDEFGWREIVGKAANI